MANYNTTAGVTVTVNGRQARDMLSTLEKDAERLKKQIEAAGKVGDKATMQKLTRELRGVKGLMKQLNESTATVEGVLDHLDKASLKNLNKTLSKLQHQLNGMERGTKLWDEQAEKIRKVQAEIHKVNTALNSQTTVWDKLKRAASIGFGGILGGVASVTAALETSKKAVTAYADMDQEMANVRKYTGMDEGQVKALNEEFKKIDTRTGREELNRLAQEAGRLGKTSQEDVLGFVKAADKINVALDDLGEGATLTLSKLTGIFGIEKEYGTEKSLLKVGSVINDLSQNCSASAPYLAEFASRLGGIAAQSKIAVTDVMAFGAVLDSNNLNVEASATAVGQLITSMYTDTAKIAKAAGMDVGEFSKLVKTDMNAALISLLEHLNQFGGMDNLAKVFEGMGTDGARAVPVLSALAGHIDELKNQQTAANAAFIEGTSIDKEFEVQNTTLQAELEKSRSRLHELVVGLGEQLVPAARGAITVTGLLVRIFGTLISFAGNNGRALVTLGAAVAGYTLATKAAVIQETIHTALMKGKAVLMAGYKAVVATLTAAYHLMAAGVMTVTGNTAGATAAMTAFNAACASNPVGAVAIALLSAAAAFGLYTAAAGDSTEQTRMMGDVVENATKKREAERQEIEAVIIRLKDFNGTKTEEQRLVMQLNSKYGPVLGTYKSVRDWLTVLRKRGDEYCDSVYRQIEAEGKLEAARQLIAMAARRRAEGKEAEPKWYQTFDQMTTFDMKKGLFHSWSEAKKLAKGNLEYEAEQEAAALEAEAKRLSDEAAKAGVHAASNLSVLNATVPESTPSAGGGNSPRTAPESEKERTARERAARKAEADSRRAETKARKEFKEGLDNIKAERDRAETEAMASRKVGLTTYQQYLDARRAAEVKYYADTEAYYKKNGLEEDADYAALMKKKEEADQKWNATRLALSRDTIRRVAQVEERDAKARFAAKRSTTLADELALEEELLKIRTKAWEDERSLYDAGSKEYEDITRKMDDAQEEEKLARQKKLAETARKFEEKFNEMEAVDKLKIELAALDEIYRQKYISEEQYQEWSRKFEEEAVKSLPGADPENNRTKSKAAQKNFDSEKRKLDAALAGGIIDETVYGERLARIKAGLEDALIAPLRQTGSEWVDMLASMYGAWKDFAEALKDPEGDPFAALSGAIQATAAVMNSVMQTVTQFVEAETQVQSDAVKQRYDKELKLAEGNSYKTKQLEKQRDRELARLKEEASQKSFAMQVISTVAQTAANAVAAYGAALETGPAGLVLAPIAAAMAVAQGAVQIALLKKQQQAAAATGYAEGGFTRPGRRLEPAGVVHAGEWVASQQLVNNPRTRPIIDMLEYAQRHNTVGSLRMEDVSMAVTAPVRAAASVSESVRDVASTAPVSVTVPESPALTEAIDRLNSRLEQPFVTVNTVTGDAGIKKAYDNYDRFIRNKSPKTAR